MNAQDLNTMSADELRTLVLKMAAQPARKLTCKVTAKKEDGKGTDGALSVYGLGRFPVTLYRSQWEQLIAFTPELQAFIAANAALLATKPISA